MRKRAIGMAALLLATGPAGAQLSVPGLGGVVDRVGGVLGDATRPVTDLARGVGALAQERLARLDDFVRNHRASVEMDDTGQPARAHELLLIDPDAASLASADKAGFRLIAQGDLEGLGLSYARLATPPGAGLPAATRHLRRLLPDKEITADQIHFASGSEQNARSGPPSTIPRGGTVGVIDGGALPGARIAAQAGFATGAPTPNAHAQSIASLLAGAGTAHIYVADVYGRDPAGGNALAIARALAWMAGRSVPVVSISLVGPANPLLARAIAAAQARGMIVTAAVGNDGAAAPPAFPASYPGVVAVTGVDGRGRVLFEAGRASHLDYAAPGADLTAIGLDGRAKTLRGTSFAAPLAAARIAALGRVGDRPSAILARADAEAQRVQQTARGVLCGECRKGL